MSRTPRAPQVPGESAPAEATDTTEQAAPQASAEPQAAAPGQLRAKDVDPSKLKRAVLTADGWVCPEKSPAPTAKE